MSCDVYQLLHQYLKFITFWLVSLSCQAHHSPLKTPLLSPAVEPFSAHNQSLDYLRGTLGFSYMCREMQTLIVAQNLSINTFQVQVQPFDVNGEAFAPGNLVSRKLLNKRV